jgi:hypothetical protein
MKAGPLVAGRLGRAPGGIGAPGRGGVVGVRLRSAQIPWSVHRSGRVPQLDHQEDWNLNKSGICSSLVQTRIWKAEFTMEENISYEHQLNKVH